MLRTKAGEQGKLILCGNGRVWFGSEEDSRISKDKSTELVPEQEEQQARHKAGKQVDEQASVK